MSNHPINYSKKDHIAQITLNSPETGNLIDQQLTGMLAEICQQINQDPEVYVALLTASGGVFSRGGNPGRPGKAADAELLPSGQSAAEAVASLECPTLAALNGDALGEGLELALACDIRIASDKAKFGLPQIQEGQIPVDGGTQRLPRIVGRGKALEMVLTGEILDAGEALDIGLVNKVVPAEDLPAEAENLARSIASKAPLALRYCKEAVNKGLDLTLEQGLRLEADLYFLLHTTADRTEGIRSFLEKRPPQYKGK